MISEKRYNRLLEASTWINNRKTVIDYVEFSERYNLSRESSRNDIIYMLQNGMISEKDVICTKDGVNGFGKTIYRLMRKYPKKPGIKASIDHGMLL